MSQGMMIDGPGDPVTDLFREIVSREYRKSFGVEGPNVLPLMFIGPGLDQTCLDAEIIRNFSHLLLRKLKEPHFGQLGDIVTPRAILPE